MTEPKWLTSRLETTPLTVATTPLMKVHRDRIDDSSLSAIPMSCAEEMSQASKQENRIDCHLIQLLFASKDDSSTYCRYTAKEATNEEERKITE